MLAILVTTLTNTLPDIVGDFIGVDGGARYLANNKIPMRLAIGDFDSVLEEDMSLIEQYADEIIRLNPIKDDSDSESAIRHVLKRGYDQLLLVGGLDGRMDHTMVNLRLVHLFANHLTLINQQNKIYGLSEGTYTIHKDDYKYLSVFTLESATVTLEGFAYPLEHRKLTHLDCYTLSNEMLGEEGVIIVENGVLIVMQTKDAKC